jgi:hypothetical protein
MVIYISFNRMSYAMDVLDQKVKSEALREYLLSRRMCSVENLTVVFDVSPGELWPLVEELREKGYARIAQKSCGSSCTTCSTTCETSSIDTTAIIVSLEKSSEDDE